MKRKAMVGFASLVLAMWGCGGDAATGEAAGADTSDGTVYATADIARQTMDTGGSGAEDTPTQPAADVRTPWMRRNQ